MIKTGLPKKGFLFIAKPASEPNKTGGRSSEKTNKYINFNDVQKVESIKHGATQLLKNNPMTNPPEGFSQKGAFIYNNVLRTPEREKFLGYTKNNASMHAILDRAYLKTVVKISNNSQQDTSRIEERIIEKKTPDRTKSTHEQARKHIEDEYDATFFGKGKNEVATSPEIRRKTSRDLKIDTKVAQVLFQQSKHLSKTHSLTRIPYGFTSKDEVKNFNHKLTEFISGFGNLVDLLKGIGLGANQQDSTPTDVTDWKNLLEKESSGKAYIQGSASLKKKPHDLDIAIIIEKDSKFEKELLALDFKGTSISKKKGYFEQKHKFNLIERGDDIKKLCAQQLKKQLITLIQEDLSTVPKNNTQMLSIINKQLVGKAEIFINNQNPAKVLTENLSKNDQKSEGIQKFKVKVNAIVKQRQEIFQLLNKLVKDADADGVLAQHTEMPNEPVDISFIVKGSDFDSANSISLQGVIDQIDSPDSISNESPKWLKAKPSS